MVFEIRAAGCSLHQDSEKLGLFGLLRLLLTSIIFYFTVSRFFGLVLHLHMNCKKHWIQLSCHWYFFHIVKLVIKLIGETQLCFLSFVIKSIQRGSFVTLQAKRGEKYVLPTFQLEKYNIVLNLLSLTLWCISPVCKKKTGLGKYWGTHIPHICYCFKILYLAKLLLLY